VPQLFNPSVALGYHPSVRMVKRPFAPADAALLLGVSALMPMANGRFAIAAIAWIAPAILIRFLRTQTWPRALAGGLVAMSIAEWFWWKGIVPVHGPAYVAAAIVFGIINLVPYLIDRTLATRLNGFAATLVLPATMVLHEALTEQVSPFGSWGSFAYTQSDNLALVQLVSITGLAGITFLMLWFASIVNWVVESQFDWRQVRWGVSVYATLLLTILLWGGMRTRGGHQPGVRIAAVTPRLPTYTVRGDDENSAVREALASMRVGKPLDEHARLAFRARAAAINQELLATSASEARRGAKVVLWSEGAGVVEWTDAAALVARAADLSRITGAYIALSFLSLDTTTGKRFANQNVLVGPQGATLWTYDKAHPVPGMEDMLRPGGGRVPGVVTPFGRVSPVICFDLDFPQLIRQAGRAGTSVLLVAADDWPEVAAGHAKMARFRAVEQGMSLLRATSNGHSVAFDRFGRRLAANDYSAGDCVLIATVPTISKPTLYTRVPDSIPLVALLLLIAMSVRALMNARRGVEAT
jgi:apolipoprotein N-acyltransferase